MKKSFIFISLYFIIISVSAQTIDSIVDIRDNQVYKIVKIGQQWWMQENLNVGTRIDGSQNTSDNGTMEKYCYDNKDSLCNIYGGLYQWNEMMDYQESDDENPGKKRGICPVGWHLPSDPEWIELFTFLGGQGVAGGKLKETGIIHWNSPNTGATNSSGFTALPAGNRQIIGSFGNIAQYGYWWSSTGSSGTNAWSWYAGNITSGITRWTYEKEYGFSIRCVQRFNQLSYLIVSDMELEMVSDLNFYGGINKIELIIINSSTNKLIDISTFNTKTTAFNLSLSSSVLSPGDSIHITITFNSPLNGIYYSDTLNIESDDPYKPVIHIPLSGYVPKTDSIIDIRNSQVYSVVKQGQQWWMQENLNIGDQISGSLNESDNGIIEKYCFDNNPGNCNIYGGLYKWNEMMDYYPSENGNPGTIQGICPVGWHLPTDEEWKEFEIYIGLSRTDADKYGWRGTGIGGKMKESGTVHWITPNTGATNESGLSVLPAGYHGNTGPGYSDLYYDTDIWSSTEYGNDYTICRTLFYDNSQVMRNPFDKNYGFSVRCLRDSDQYSYLTVSDDNFKSISALDFRGGINVKDILFINSGTKNIINITSLSNGNPVFSLSKATTILAPGDSVHLKIIFNPQIKGLDYYDTLLIESDDPFKPLISLPLEGSEPVLDSIIDIRDDQIYEVVKIGKQWWMQENINIGIRIDANLNESDNGVIEKYCYDNNESQCHIYGGLYQWNEMANYGPDDASNPGTTRGICMYGWHLPTDAEWTELSDFLGGESVAGGKLKESGTMHWMNPNTGATNLSGFNALAAGYRRHDYWTLGKGYDANFWSTSNIGAVGGFFYRNLGYNSAEFKKRYEEGIFGFSVRCLRDSDQYSYLTITDSDMKTVSELDFFNHHNTKELILINSNPVKTINILSIHKNNPAFSLNKSSAILLPGDSIHLKIEFNPTVESCYYYDTLKISSDDPYKPLINIPLKGYLPEIDSIIDIRDYQVYNIVKINQQWWMQENLNIGDRIIGTLNASDNGVIEKYCYNNISNNCNIYGGLYQWNEMMEYGSSGYENPSDARGICPVGWYLPSINAWDEMTEFLGGESVAGGKLKETGPLNWLKPNEGATNESGFTALPCGYRMENGLFHGAGDVGILWSSTQNSSDYAWYMILDHTNSRIVPTNYSKILGLSVRCFRDVSQLGFLLVSDVNFKPVSELVFYGDNVTEEILLINEMAGKTINISSISNNNSAFHLNYSSAVLTSGDSLHLTITFNPPTKDIYPDTLFIVSDDPYNSLIKIPLFGTFPPEISFTESTNISCYGYSDGSVTINPSLGTPPYQYHWDDPNNTTDSIVTGLLANIYYSITVTDALGWTVTDSIMLSEPEPLMVQSDYSDTICLGRSNGFINLDPSGGTSPYSYSWSNGAETQNISGLSAGSYNVTVKDANMCEIAEDFIINSAVPYENQKICIVTTDIISGKNLIIWEKPPDKLGIEFFNIYREGAVIGTVPYNALSVFEDTVADPEKRPYLYTISVVDTCDNESAQSSFHKPHFLQYVSSSGGVNLEWDEYEIGDDIMNFDSYSIYRGSDSTSLSLLEDNIPVQVNVYTDKSPEANGRRYYYRVAGVLKNTCDPSEGKKAGSGPYSQSMSNMEDNRFLTGVENDFTENSSVTIYPNPFSESATLSFSNPGGSEFALIIMDISGKVCRIVENIFTSTSLLEKGDLQSGFYIIELRGPEIYRGRIIVE
jgi:uncharacterized protein (TIGR02145 family)